MPFDFNDINQVKKAYFDKLQELEKRDDEKIDLITEAAKAEQKNAIAREQITTKLKIEGHPATIIKDLVGGQTSQQKFDYEIAKGVMKAHEGSLKVLYSKIDYLRSLLSSAKKEIDIR